MNRYEEVSGVVEDDNKIITTDGLKRTSERIPLEVSPQSIGSVYDGRTGESYLQDQILQKHCSPSAFHQHHHRQYHSNQKLQMQSTSAIPSHDCETFQLFDITHQSLWRSYEPCGPMSGSVCSSSSMFTSTTESIVLGSEEISCCGDAKGTLEHFGRFFNNRSLSDITIKVGSRSFKSHRLILANTSDVFERMLCSRDWRESSTLELELHEELECERVFGLFLKFLYSRSINLNVDNTLPLLALADKYNVDDLKRSCLKFSLDHVLVRVQLKEIFHLWFQFAVRNMHRDLIAACVALLAEKAEEIMFSPDWENEWLNMDRDQLVEILKCSDLVVKDEKDVWVAVQLWTNKNSSNKNGCGTVDNDKQVKNYCSETSKASSGTTGSRNFNQDITQSSMINQQEENDLNVILPHIRFAMMSASQLCEIEKSNIAERHPELFMRYINCAYKYLSLSLTARSKMHEFSGPAFLLRNYLDLRWDKRLVISNFHSYGERSEVVLRFSTLACTVPAQSWEWELKVYPRNPTPSYISDRFADYRGECRMILSSNMALDQHPRPLEFQLGIVVARGEQQKEILLINGRKNFCRGRFSIEPTELDQRLSLNQLTNQIRGHDEGDDDYNDDSSAFLIDGSLILQVTFKPIND